MSFLELKHLAVAQTVVPVILMGTTYAMAVGAGHVPAWLPFISDTGAHVPESCVFTLGICLGSILTLAAAYLQWLHVHTLLAEDNGDLPEGINKKSLRLQNDIAFGFLNLAMLGMMLVGSFQVTNVPTVHNIGAGMLFLLGNVYTIMMCVIFSKILKDRLFVKIRVGIVVMTFVFFIIHYGAMFAGMDKATPHNIAAFAEWSMTFMLLAFFSTYYSEFSRIRFAPAIITVQDAKYLLADSNVQRF